MVADRSKGTRNDSGDTQPPYETSNFNSIMEARRRGQIDAYGHCLAMVKATIGNNGHLPPERVAEMIVRAIEDVRCHGGLTMLPPVRYVTHEISWHTRIMARPAVSYRCEECMRLDIKRLRDRCVGFAVAPYAAVAGMRVCDCQARL